MDLGCYRFGPVSPGPILGQAPVTREVVRYIDHGGPAAGLDSLHPPHKFRSDVVLCKPDRVVRRESLHRALREKFFHQGSELGVESLVAAGRLDKQESALVDVISEVRFLLVVQGQ